MGLGRSAVRKSVAAAIFNQMPSAASSRHVLSDVYAEAALLELHRLIMEHGADFIAIQIGEIARPKR